MGCENFYTSKEGEKKRDNDLVKRCTAKMDLYWPTMYDNISEYVVEICKVNKHHTMIMLQYWYWLIGPKPFQPEPYPTCVYLLLKLYKFIGKCSNQCFGETPLLLHKTCR